MYGSGVVSSSRAENVSHTTLLRKTLRELLGRLLWLSSSHSADICLTVKAEMEYKNSQRELPRVKMRCVIHTKSNRGLLRRDAYPLLILSISYLGFTSSARNLDSDFLMISFCSDVRPGML